MALALLIEYLPGLGWSSTKGSEDPNTPEFRFVNVLPCETPPFTVVQAK